MAKKKKQKRKKTGEYAAVVVRRKGAKKEIEVLMDNITVKEARALVFSHKPSAKNGKAMILAPGYKKHLRKKGCAAI